METIQGNNNYVVQIDDQGNVNNIIYAPIGVIVTSNHDEFNTRKMEALTEEEAFLEVTKPEYTLNIEELPIEGAKVYEKTFYKYGDSIVICRQEHLRTIYPPEQTPALFSFHRVDTGDLIWIENEVIALDVIRYYNSVAYKCIQAHMTVTGQTPDLTPALWIINQAGISIWIQPTGGHDAYNIGDRVHFPTVTDPIYESLINANVWSPTVYPAGWQLI